MSKDRKVAQNVNGEELYNWGSRTLFPAVKARWALRAKKESEVVTIWCIIFRCLKNGQKHGKRLRVQDNIDDQFS